MEQEKGARQGYSVSLSSDGIVLAVGSSGGSGKLRMYKWDGSSWGRKGSDLSGTSNSLLGSSIALSSDGNTVAGGARQYESDNRGTIRVYNWNGSSWVQLGNDAALQGVNVGGSSQYRGKAISLSSDGTTLAAGVDGYKHSYVPNSGTAMVFKWSGSAWNQLGASTDLQGSNKWQAQRHGHNVSLSSDGTIIAVSGKSNDNGKGEVKIHKWDGSSWSQLGSTIAGAVNNENFGWGLSLSSDGTTVAAGAPGHDSKGTVRVYNLAPDSPVVTGTTIANNNSTIAVTFNEAVFDTNGGSGALEVSDFALSISGGVATVNATPSSISPSGNVYTLGLNLSGTPSGAETLTVVPSENAMYDASGSAASTTQSNNTISLNDQAVPIVSGTTVASNNSTIAVTFSEAVFDTNGGSGALEVSDFALSISGGVATVNATPSSISISGNVYTLGLNLSGTPNGAETLTVVPSGATAIYDASGNAASTTQSNNTISLNDQAVPIVSGTTVASNNTTIAVTFSEAVFNTNGGSGALEVSDFALSISGGVATVNATPSSISISGNVYTLGLNLSGTPNGAETLTVVPSGATAIYDASGSAASTTQSNNTD